MPITADNQRYMMRHLYAGQLENITLLKRGSDQDSTYVSYKLFGCRSSYKYRIGETSITDLDVGNNTIWHIPREQLDRVGVQYINHLDKIVDSQGRHWQPEANTAGMTIKLLNTHVCIACKQTKEGTAGQAR